VALTYVLGVAAVATVGFTIASTSLLLLAAVVTLPSSAIAVPAFYVAVGLLGLIPGANPSLSTGSGSCTPSADCQTTTGDPASWFLLASNVLGVLAVAAAASLNVVLIRALIAARRTKSQTATRPPA
jgi:hypothetical protein